MGILASDHLTTSVISSHTTKTFSALWVLIKNPKCAPVIIGCVYHPPNASVAETHDYLSSNIIKLSKKYPNAKFTITGDFNRLPIQDIQTQNNLRNIVNFNTREDAMLDLILTDSDEYDNAVELSPIANNNHCCILVNGVKTGSRKYKKIKKRLVNEQRKISVYHAVALERWQEVFEASNVHDKALAFHQIIDRILDKHCPKQTLKCRADKPPWITNSIIKLIHARDKARRNKCKSHAFLRAFVQRKIRSSKRSFINNEHNNKQNTKEWWNTLNTITKKAKQSSTPSKIYINGEFLKPKDFATDINSYYAGVGGEAIESQGIPIINSNNTPLEPISIGEVKQLIKKLDKTKTTSSEDYPTWLSVECVEDICIPVHHIINCMLTTAEYPDLWKRAQISPIPKCSSPAEFKHFRPISLLFHIGKLAEEVIVRKMRSKLDEVIKPSQYAYRPGISTTDALLQYVDDFTKFLVDQKNKFVQSACLDFSKAFDRLQPSIVLSKMRSYSFNENAIKLVSNFLANRKQCVKFCEDFSDYTSIEVGSPQGTKLGPVLWLIYVNDLEVDGFYSLKYADDTTFYKPCDNTNDCSQIGSAIESASKWSSENSMLLNADKTVILNTTLSKSANFESDVLVNDVAISPSDETKFLGIIVDDKLSFSSHVDHIISKCNSRLFLMRQLKVLGLNAAGLKTFYTSNIRSLLLYGAPAWHSILNSTCKDKLELVQRSASRIIYPDLCHEERLALLSLPLLNDFIFSICANHFRSISANPNHPLFNRIIFNNLKRSSRVTNTCSVYRPEIARTQKRSKSFFQYFMRFLITEIFI